MTTVRKLTDTDILALLQRPFDPSVVKQKGRFSYISHGLITQRLTEADPHWESRVIETHTYTDANGVLHCGGITLELGINFPEAGIVRRMESGGPQRSERFDLEIKNAQSDALKRCAMRFGVALEMWESLIDADGDEDYHPTPKPMTERREVNGMPNPPTAVPAVNAGLSAQQHQAIIRLGAELNDTAWVQGLLTKHGVDAAEFLTMRSASTVITNMQARLNEQRKKQKAPVSGGLS